VWWWIIILTYITTTTAKRWFKTSRLWPCQGVWSASSQLFARSRDSLVQSTWCPPRLEKVWNSDWYLVSWLYICRNGQWKAIVPRTKRNWRTSLDFQSDGNTERGIVPGTSWIAWMGKTHICTLSSSTITGISARLGHCWIRFIECTRKNSCNLTWANLFWIENAAIWPNEENYCCKCFKAPILWIILEGEGRRGEEEGRHGFDFTATKFQLKHSQHFNEKGRKG